MPDFMTTHPLNPDPGYFKNYILNVPEGDVLHHLEDQKKQIEQLLGPLSEEKGKYAYAEGKWSIKELLGHITDAERIFAYRALRFARNDKTPLASFEENDYVANGFFNFRKMSDLLNEYSLVRQSTIAMFKGFNEEELQREGTASNRVLSVNQLLYIIPGHELHHIGILKERYGI
jgi:uncharacterized damage-inducible protein DinB